MTPDDGCASETPAAATQAPHELEIQVRFGDTDALGHVNNAAYATYAELGRIALMRRVRWDEGGPILARIAIDFHAQVRLGSRVVVTTKVTRIGRSSIGLHQEVQADGERAATVESVVVWFDYDAQRPVPVPDHVRSVLLGGLGADV
jgi:acyl-CoA thioester hydrolase